MTCHFADDESQERIQTLTLEVNRLKGRLAAEAGDEDLLKFVLQCSAEERSYIDDLKKRLAYVLASYHQRYLFTLNLNSDAERKAAAADKVQDIDVKRKLLEVTKQLEKYQTVFGESASSQSGEVQASTQQLHAKQDEIQKLRLQDQQREQVVCMLISYLNLLLTSSPG